MVVVAAVLVPGALASVGLVAAGVTAPVVAFQDQKRKQALNRGPPKSFEEFSVDFNLFWEDLLEYTGELFRAGPRPPPWAEGVGGCGALGALPRPALLAVVGHLRAADVAALECTCRLLSRAPRPVSMLRAPCDGGQALPWPELCAREALLRRSVGCPAAFSLVRDVLAGRHRLLPSAVKVHPTRPAREWRAALRLRDAQEGSAARHGGRLAAATHWTACVSWDGRVRARGDVPRHLRAFLGAGASGAWDAPYEVPGEHVVSVAAGERHVALVTATGKLFTAGYGGHGQLGHGGLSAELAPRRVEGLERVVSAAVGAHHTLALDAEGSVWSFGEGRRGRLGHGSEAAELRPRLVEALEGTRVVQVAAGDAHSVALSAGGAVLTFGGGGSGTAPGGLGHGEDLGDELWPRHVAELEEVAVGAVFAGPCVTAAVSEGGSAYLWGAAAAPAGGEEGGCSRLATGGAAHANAPALVAGLGGVRAAALGRHHTALLCEDGSVWTCGDGRHGRLGHGSQEPSRLPRRVEGLESCGEVAVGTYHTASLGAWDGGVSVWGLVGAHSLAADLRPRLVDAPEEEEGGEEAAWA